MAIAEICLNLPAATAKKVITAANLNPLHFVSQSPLVQIPKAIGNGYATIGKYLFPIASCLFLSFDS